MQDDARCRVFRISLDRAALQTFRVEAMIAAHGKVVPAGVRVRAAFDLSNTPPANLCRVAVLLVAGDLAGAAADALIHVEVEAVLLARFKRSFRDQFLRGDGNRRWEFGEAGHCQAHEGVAVSILCSILQR